MELRVLRYFLAVAREENVSRAAEFLNVTQPTLSRQIMDMEDELGVTLFIRGSRKITLTDEGILLRKRAEEILDLVRKAEAELSAPDDIVSGEIFIGGGETDAMRILARVVRELQADYPAIHLNIFSGNGGDVAERLDKGLLDFGVFVGLVDMAKYESLRLPAADTWGVLMRRDSPLASRKAIKPDDLWNLPLIVSGQAMSSGELSGWLKRGGEQLNIVATYNLIYNASLMVEEGMGYALTLDKLINTTGSGALCFIPCEPKLEANLYLVWKKYQVFSKAARLFLERTRAAIG